MRKYWWTVWIKVAVIALVLVLAYQFASSKIEQMVSPYLIEETQSASDEVLQDERNLVMKTLGKIEEFFNVKIDFESLIFDYANEYALGIIEQSKEERNVISEPLS